MGKRRDQTGSKRKGNVSLWKQEKCFLFVVEQGEGCLLFSSEHAYCFLVSLQQHPSVHEERVGFACCTLHTQSTPEDGNFISRGKRVSSAVR